MFFFFWLVYDPHTYCVSRSLPRNQPDFRNFLKVFQNPWYANPLHHTRFTADCPIFRKLSQTYSKQEKQSEPMPSLNNKYSRNAMRLYASYLACTGTSSVNCSTHVPEMCKRAWYFLSFLAPKLMNRARNDFMPLLD